MLTLRRTVRLVINPPGVDAPHGASNGFAGTPAMIGFGHYIEVDVDCRGVPDDDTAYLVNIKVIDEAVQHAARPILEHTIRSEPQTNPAALMPTLYAALHGHLESILDAVTLRLTPTWSLSIGSDDMTTVTIKQQFDFAASHRLHNPAFDDEQNRRFYGKCNNPAGHGHNYRIEPAVDVGPDATFSLPELERVTAQTIIDWLDHTNLSEDVPEFDPSRGGVIPSVENIARLCMERLNKALDDTPHVKLRAVTVWETDRTSATCPAD